MKYYSRLIFCFDVIRDWINYIKEKYIDFIEIEELINENDIFYKIFIFNKFNDNIGAEIFVGESNFAPYENIYFEVVELINKDYSFLFSYYDSKDDTKDDILFNLEKGLYIILNYGSVI